MIATTFENTAEVETPELKINVPTFLWEFNHNGWSVEDMKEYGYSDKEIKKEIEKAGNPLLQVFNALSFGLVDYIQEVKESLAFSKEFDEFQRQEEIQWLYESVYTQGKFTDGEEFKKDLEKLLKINEHIIHIHGEITMDDLSNYHMVLSDDKKAELDQLRTNYQQEKNNNSTLEA